MKNIPSGRGSTLNREWRVGAAHALYHKDGTFYERLKRFPGALFDAVGYVVFQSEEELERCRSVQLGKKLNVPAGISYLPGYKRKPL